MRKLRRKATPARRRYHFERMDLGHTYLATPGTDYDHPLKFQAAAWKWAQEKQITVTTRRVPDGLEITFTGGEHDQ
jgi:hypothetical protein